MGNSTSFNSKTAPRQGGKRGRIARKTLLRKNLELAAAGTHLDAKTFMLHVINDETLPLPIRQVAARDVIAFTHKKMPQSVELDANVKLKGDFASAVATFTVPVGEDPSQGTDKGE